jgi:putative hydrolase of the HAD superfamily
LVQAIFFDAGNTLFHTSFGRRERIRRALASKGLAFTLEAVEKGVSQVEGELLGPDKPRIGTEEEEAHFWQRYYPGLLEALGIRDERGELARYLKRETLYIKWCVVYPEVHAVLGALQGRYRLGLISNAYPSMREALDHLALSGYFQSIVISAEVGVRKPDPLIYQTALESLGVAAEDSIFVDDTERNVLAAEEMGMTAFLIDRRGQHPEADCRKIENLKEVVDYVLSCTSSSGVY